MFILFRLLAELMFIWLLLVTVVFMGFYELYELYEFLWVSVSYYELL